MTVLDRLLSKIEVGDCWQWTGATNPGGYGNFFVSRGRWVVAHRALYEMLIGPIPEGMVLDHLCKNTGCVNPDHLEVVTQAENVQRGVRWDNNEMCKSGRHELAGNSGRNTRGTRYCRPCDNEKRRAKYAEKRVAA